MIDSQFIRRLSSELALDVPPEDLEPLAVKFEEQMKVIRSLGQLDVADVSPGVAFDVHWDS